MCGSLIVRVSMTTGVVVSHCMWPTMHPFGGGVIASQQRARTTASVL